MAVETLSHTDYLKSLDACDDAVKWSADYRSLSDCWQKCERSDWMMWLLRKTDKISKKQAVTYAIWCAESVIGEFEKKYPEDDRPRDATEAAKKWVDEPSEENRDAAAYAARAADAAYYAARAADAADAAAYAAARKPQADKLREIIGNPYEVI